MSLKKRLRKVAVVAAVAIASYYTGGAAAAAYAKYKAAKKPQAGPQFIGVPPDYSAPYNPGYSYTGSPEQYTGAATQTFGGYGGAAVPIEKSASDVPRAGFSITPIMALGALGVLGVGFMLLRR